jgi:hypothetical protein
MSILDDPGIQKVWLGDRLIFDRATDARHPMDVLGLVLFGGAEDVGQGTADLCTGAGDG